MNAFQIAILVLGSVPTAILIVFAAAGVSAGVRHPSMFLPGCLLFAVAAVAVLILRLMIGWAS